ncbi:MAG: tRNA (adenosine(37)-N6)-threonylcarbamoyltransferase complex transferase subunit TsaD [Alphaproteobacteria bacterium]
MKILGFETSCDDTSVAVVQVTAGRGTIIAQHTYTQVEEHAKWGGVVPDIASRAHLEHLPRLYAQTLASANVTLAEIDGIAATVGPGLVGTLLMGSMFGKALAMGAGKPFIGVNHLEGHALSPLLMPDSPVTFPYLLLLVSGGHCVIVRVDGLGQYKTLGSTRDDAAGECLDKSARLLGLRPSGAALEKAAQGGDPFAYPLPNPKVDGLDFSFSGLKTAIALQVQKAGALDDTARANMAASIQRAVATTIAYKVEKAVKETNLTTVVVAGGVAANAEVRTLLTTVCTRQGATLVVPPFALCTDNAAMIALAGGLRLQHQNVYDWGLPVRPRWPLDEMTAIV